MPKEKALRQHLVSCFRAKPMWALIPSSRMSPSHCGARRPREPNIRCGKFSNTCESLSGIFWNSPAIPNTNRPSFRRGIGPARQRLQTIRRGKRASAPSARILRRSANSWSMKKRICLPGFRTAKVRRSCGRLWLPLTTTPITWGKPCSSAAFWARGNSLLHRSVPVRTGDMWRAASLFTLRSGGGGGMT